MTQKIYIFLFTVILIFLSSSCSDEGPVGPGITSDKPNILLIIADDMGLDATPGYDIGIEKPEMPNLEKMINEGIKFNNLWSYPSCTPTRSSIITGKYGFRTGVTQVGDILSTSELSLQRYLDNNNSQYSHGTAQSYNRWSLTENEVSSTTTEYATSKFTDLAIEWIEGQDNPWFLWLAYNAPHTPFHLPPSELHNRENLQDDQASIDANPLPYYLAMIEAMDTEIGRLLNSMAVQERENTIIIFIGDNGTSGQVVQEYNNRRAKGSVYQGGVNVPMIISGAGVSRRGTEDALINTTDLFSTIADIAGVANSDINDSKSFKPLLTNEISPIRDVVYTETGSNTGGLDITIRNATHKYILFEDGTEALYNLEANPLENPNLLNTNQLPLSESDQEVLNFLLEQLDEIR